MVINIVNKGVVVIMFNTINVGIARNWEVSAE